MTSQPNYMLRFFICQIFWPRNILFTSLRVYTMLTNRITAKIDIDNFYDTCSFFNIGTFNNNNHFWAKITNLMMYFFQDVTHLHCFDVYKKMWDNEW